MRFLANENFPFEELLRRLRAAGHDVVSVGETMQGSKDEEVLSLAAREERVILTFDRDYGGSTPTGEAWSLLEGWSICVSCR